jgi:hypothetical protein
MLRITDQATTHLIRSRAENGFDDHAGARFVRGSAGVGLTFSSLPEPGDQVIAEGSRLPIYVADEVRAVLDQAVIDVAPDDGESRLVVRSQMESSQAHS